MKKAVLISFSRYEKLIGSSLKGDHSVSQADIKTDVQDAEKENEAVHLRSKRVLPPTPKDETVEEQSKTKETLKNGQLSSEYSPSASSDLFSSDSPTVLPPPPGHPLRNKIKRNQEKTTKSSWLKLWK